MTIGGAILPKPRWGLRRWEPGTQGSRLRGNPGLDIESPTGYMVVTARYGAMLPKLDCAFF